MIQPHQIEHHDNQTLSYKSFQSNDFQVSKSLVESSINGQVTHVSIDQTSKKPSGRSWARSKRISLGCFEWHSRGPFRQTDIGSSNRLNSINPTGSHHWIVHNEENFTYICQEPSKARLKSGADSLLQRLRKRSFSRDKHKRDNKTQYCRSSSAPRSVYSYQSAAEFEINHIDKYSLTQRNKYGNLFVSNLIPQICLSRSVPELQDHSCVPSGYLDNGLSYQCNVIPSELYPKSSSHLTSCFPVNNDKINAIATTTTSIINNNQMELSKIDNSSYDLPIKDKTPINHELYLQSNYQTSINANILHGNFVNSCTTSSTPTIMKDSCCLKSNSECVDIPNAMKYSDSFVLLDKRQQYQPLYNPFTSSIYSEVCSKCCFTYDNNNNDNNQSTVTTNSPNLLVNSLSYSCEIKHSPGRKTNKSPNEQISYPNMVKVNGDFTTGHNNNHQLITLDAPPTPSPSNIPNDHISNNSNIVDLGQTQNNSSCNSLRPDSLLSTSTTITTTTRESSCSDLSPNSMSSHDSALGGGKFQSDSGPLKTDCPNTITTPSTTNCMKNIDQLNYMKSPDMSTCINNNNRHLDPKDLYPIPPLCVPPSGNYCCSHTPPTPVRRPWLGDNSEQIATGRSRSGGQKRSVYVNASIYPIPEMIRNNDSNGNNFSGYVRDRENSTDIVITSTSSNPVNASTTEVITTISNHNNDKTTPSNTSSVPIPYWTHLLPYRTSTVPQNLSGRLRKSETLPNDWVNHEPNKIVDHAIHSIPKSTSHQLNILNQNHNSQRSNHSDECKSRSYVNYTPNLNHNFIDNAKNINRKEAKSPPPRPPMRTSSHVAPRQNIVSSSISPYCHHRHCQRHFALGLLDKSTKANTDEQHSNTNNIPTENLNKSINESPILCRYSQLYSLNTEAKKINDNNGNDNNNPINCNSYSQYTAINNMTSSAIHTSNNKTNTPSLPPHRYIHYEQQQQQQFSTHHHHHHHHHPHPVQYQQCQSNASNHRSNYKQLVEFDMKNVRK
uniref:SH2 domain-containing protein n=2 Tax=Schistosoma mansoni TaxID=6183 RepID=A0A5K4F2R0_SCHMA